MTQQPFFKKPAVRLALSCIFLFLLYFTMEAAVLLPPSLSDLSWYSTLRLLTSLLLGPPWVFLGPVIALILGIWFGRNMRLTTLKFILRLCAIAGGCALALTLASIRGWYINMFGWFNSTYILDAMPPFTFLIGGIAARIYQRIRSHLRT